MSAALSHFERLEKAVAGMREEIPAEKLAAAPLGEQQTVAELTMQGLAALALCETIGGLCNDLRGAFDELMRANREDATALAQGIEKIGTEVDWLRKEIEAK